MKYLLALIFLIFFKITSFGQKSVFFKGIEFDSSYSIIGIGQGYDNIHDSLPGFWFFIDHPEDMVKLKRNWVFKYPVPKIKLEEKAIEIYIIKDKRLINPGGLIFPLQGIIKSEYNWYPFDTVELVRLHKEHHLSTTLKRVSLIRICNMLLMLTVSSGTQHYFFSLSHL